MFARLQQQKSSCSLRRRLSSSAVIFSASRERPRLSALHLRDTASILSPEWRHLAPCLGAALMASPLAGNLMRMGQLVHPQATQYYKGDSPSSAISTELFQASRLASRLFFQLIRESPLHVTSTKSLPASYLTPSLMGTLLGLSISGHVPSSMRNVLREYHGIKSNYIEETKWTGVSLTRWMDLISTNVLGSTTNDAIPLVSSVWLMALWELGDSKSDFLDFLMALERMLVQSEKPCSRILDVSNPLAQAILHDPIARKEWASTEFDASLHLSPDSVGASLDRLLWQSRDRGRNDPTVSLEWTTALEIVCAFVSLNHLPLSSRPTCPTGYYGFDGGGIQADCAEHTVREIINVLLWDERRGGFFDVDRLPSAASPQLAPLYDNLVHPFDQSGKAWFEILSDLPGCEYLAKSPNGRSYELAPTVANILRCLQILLFGGGRTINEPVWSSFQDLAESWKFETLQVYEMTLTHKSAKTGAFIYHEFATLRLENATSGIELRLRYNKADNSGMSKVTHLQDRKVLIRSDQLNAMMEPKSPAAIKVLALAFAGNVLLEPYMSDQSADPSLKELVHILGTPFGCDRRWLLTTDTDESALQAALKESESILKTSMKKICQWSNTDELLGATLLPWVFSERPSVFEGKMPITTEREPEIEHSVLALPVGLLGNNTVHEAVEFNWAVRGRPLAAWARWKSGSSAIAKEVSHLGATDLLPFGTFLLKR